MWYLPSDDAAPETEPKRAEPNSAEPDSPNTILAVGVFDEHTSSLPECILPPQAAPDGIQGGRLPSLPSAATAERSMVAVLDRVSKLQDELGAPDSVTRRRPHDFAVLTPLLVLVFMMLCACVGALAGPLLGSIPKAPASPSQGHLTCVSWPAHAETSCYQLRASRPAKPTDGSTSRDRDRQRKALPSSWSFPGESVDPLFDASLSRLSKADIGVDAPSSGPHTARPFVHHSAARYAETLWVAGWLAG